MSELLANTNQPTSTRTLGNKPKWLLLFLFVFVPWVLVSVPGERRDTESNLPIRHFEHGWPFVHFDSVNVSPYLIKNFQSSAQGLLEEFQANSIQQDGGWSLESNLAGNAQSTSFWSNLDSWPLPLSGRIGRFRWPGLIANIVILAVVSFLMVKLASYRTKKRGGILRFSIFELLILTGGLGVGMFFVAREFDHAKRESESLELLDSVFGNVHTAERSANFPGALSRLLDHRIHRHGQRSLKLFCPAKKIFIGDSKMQIRNLSNSEIEILAQAFNQSTATFTLELKAFPQTIRFLNAIDRTKLESVNLTAIHPSVLNYVDQETLFSEMKEHYGYPGSGWMSDVPGPAGPLTAVMSVYNWQTPGSND